MSDVAVTDLLQRAGLSEAIQFLPFFNRPCELSDCLHHVQSNVAEEKDAFSRQAVRDWETILLHRARELATGMKGIVQGAHFIQRLYYSYYNLLTALSQYLNQFWLIKSGVLHTRPILHETLMIIVLDMSLKNDLILYIAASPEGQLLKPTWLAFRWPVCDGHILCGWRRTVPGQHKAYQAVHVCLYAATLATDDGGRQNNTGDNRGP